MPYFSIRGSKGFLAPFRRLRRASGCSRTTGESQRRRAAAIGLFVKPFYAREVIWNFRADPLHSAMLRGALEAHMFPGAYKIRTGAVPDRGRGLGHTAPTYFS